MPSFPGFPLGQGKSENLLEGQEKSGKSEIFTSKSGKSQGRIFCELGKVCCAVFFTSFFTILGTW